MKRTLLLFTVLCTSIITYAQDPLYNTISGTIWRDGNSDGIRDAGESLLPGILVNFTDASTDSVYSVAITDTNGVFTLPNYKGTGNFYLDYYFPSAGFTVTTARAGSDNTVNSAASDGSPSGSTDAIASATFTISANTNMDTFGMGLVRIPATTTYWASMPSTPTNWDQTFKFPKSYDGTGTLLKTTIFTTDAAFHANIGIENTGVSPESAELDVSGRITLTLPVGSNIITNTNAVKIAALDAYDGTTDYTGTSGFTWYNSFGSDVNTRNITQASLLMSYRTSNVNDSIAITATTTSATTIIGSGNLFANVTTDVAAGVYVTYTYSTALPVSLISFTAARKNEAALLNWIAVSSSDDQGFAVEHSTDGISFKEIGFVASSLANPGNTSDYTFTDGHPAAGLNIYRLSMKENGLPFYSGTVSLSFAGNNTRSIYPNPATTAVTVITSENSQLILYNQLGQVISVPVAQNSTQSILDVSTLKSGVYNLQVIEAGVSSMQKLIIQ